MKSIDKFVLVLVASLALLLAGCGGGSSTTTPPEDTGPTAEEMAAAAIMEAKGALTTAQGQLSGATTDAEMLAAYQAIHGAAQNLITVLGANGGSADDIVAATVARENASDMISSLTEKIADAAEAAAAAELAAMIKKFGTKNTAMDAEAAQGPGQSPANPDAGLGGSVADGATSTYSMAISRDSSGTTEVKITDTALNGDDDPKFMQTNVSDGLTKNVRTMEADDDGNVVEETAMVMTDIAAAKATAFAMVSGQALNARDLDPGTDGPDDDTTVDNDFTALTVDQTSTDVLALVKSSSFSAGDGDSTTHTFSFDNTVTTSVDEADEVRGTYNGAMGTFRCNGTADCTVTVDGEGMITAMTAGWVFTPDAGATSDVPDPMYQHYGFWIEKTTDSDGVVTYNEVETFTGVNGMLVQDTSTLTGTAKYSGGALGVYTHKVLDPEGESTAVSGGHFTADANLTATFGQVEVGGVGTIAPNMLNTVTGTIDNFMLAGGESNSWSVSLEGTNASGVVTGTGWSAQFYGANVDDTPGTLDDDTANPAAILGEFNATFVNGQVAGAFGADLEE